MKKRIIIGIFLTTAVFFLYLFFTGRFAPPNPLPSKTLSSYKLPEKIDRSPKAQAQAARDFLSLLDEHMREQTQFPLDSPERKKWTNHPPKHSEKGARLGDLTQKQIEAGLHLLSTILSKEGFYRVRNVPLADDHIVPEGKRYVGFGAEDFRLVIFGEPAEDSPWAVQFDGHHLAVNINIHGNQMSLSPSLIGTEPHQFHLDGEVIRPIKAFTDKAYALIQSLAGEQKKKAIISETSEDTQLAEPEFDGFIPDLQGIKGAELSSSHKAQLLGLIAEYVRSLPEHAAKVRIQQLKAEIDEIHFSWCGPTTEKSAVSYRIQGPSLIIEYACQLFIPERPFDHIHTIYRDPSNEYGHRFMNPSTRD